MEKEKIAIIEIKIKDFSCMKYQELSSFERHLKNSFPNDLQYLYFLVVPDDFERSKIIDTILCYLPKALFSVTKIFAEDSSSKEVIQALESFSFLGEKEIVIVYDVDLFHKKDLQIIISYLKKHPLSEFLIFASKNKKTLTLLNEVDQRGVVLDLSTEKFWDKKKRLINTMIEKCAQAKKMISEDAKDFFLSTVGLDPAAIENEIEKLICYVGEKKIIEISDIAAICSNYQQKNVWQIAEKIVWEEDPFSVEIASHLQKDKTFFYSLIVACRYHLKEGLKLSETPLNEAVFSETLQKKKMKALFLGSFFFKKALHILLEIELLSKNGGTTFLALLDLFRAKLKHHLYYETNITS